jgi:endo-alpha-1,4-polygalactosaminidase (GH114 family)
MGCSFDLGDDFEKCQLLIEQYEELLENEKKEPMNKKNKEKIEKAKEDLKSKIKDKLEYINNRAENLIQIEKLQKLNERFQFLLTDESKEKI